MEMVKPVGVLTTTREEKNLNYQVHIISSSPYFSYLHCGHVLKAELPKHKMTTHLSRYWVFTEIWVHGREYKLQRHTMHRAERDHLKISCLWWCCYDSLKLPSKPFYILLYYIYILYYQMTTPQKLNDYWTVVLTSFSFTSFLGCQRRKTHAEDSTVGQLSQQGHWRWLFSCWNKLNITEYLSFFGRL